MPAIGLSTTEVPSISGLPGSAPTVGDGDGAVCHPIFEVGETTGVAAKLTKGGAMLDVALLYSGPPRIAQGLGITVSGLAATVGVGIAISQGVLSVEAAIGSIVVVDNSTNYLWLQQISPAATPIVTNSPTLPGTGAVYLGAVILVAGAATIDTSGVVYAVGGLPRRETDDAGAPADTPGAYALLTKTAGGLWLWDGAAHYKLVSGGASGTAALAKITGGGADGSLTILNGVITAIVAPT